MCASRRRSNRKMFPKLDQKLFERCRDTLLLKVFKAHKGEIQTKGGCPRAYQWKAWKNVGTGLPTYRVWTVYQWAWVESRVQRDRVRRKCSYKNRITVFTIENVTPKHYGTVISQHVQLHCSLSSRLITVIRLQTKHLLMLLAGALVFLL